MTGRSQAADMSVAMLKMFVTNVHGHSKCSTFIHIETSNNGSAKHVPDSILQTPPPTRTVSANLRASRVKATLRAYNRTVMRTELAAAVCN